ncbi:MAG: ferrous iron transport protein A [Actinobacteria bacterium]|nr:MAG: ferrous iron transport protein A [Actinomycetota bacterium]
MPARLARRARGRAGREFRAEIVRLAEHDGELLHWFYDEGLVPGTPVELHDAQPAAGQLKVAVDGAERAIGEKAALGIYVRTA